METLVSAVLGDLISRAISTVVKKCGEQATAKEQTTTEEDLQRLHQLLLRISTVVEEAEGRCITNRGMIRQVSMMREQMIRGHYLLDSFKCTQKTDDDEVSQPSFSQSKFNPAKRFRRLSSDDRIESMVIGRVNNKELKQAVLVLENMVSDMNEFAIFLPTYPRLRRQPYGAYLYLDKYMFGRQMEREQAVSFLLQAEPNGNLGVLPIVGPGRIGKSTFVEHICDDERVRNHFSLIFLFSGNGLKDETATTFRDHCVIKHRKIASGEERCLAVIELVGDNVDEGAWKRLLRSCKMSMAPGSKIIITSRSEKTAASLGTTGALRLNYLSKEAYWYFFRMLLFGSTDPEEHPRLTSIAMEMARELCGSFILAHDVAALLRENLSALFWGRVLRHLREQRQRNIMLLGEYCLEGGRPRYVWSMPNTRRGPGDISFFLLCDDCQKGPAAYGEVPRIRVLDLLSGTWSATPRGKFEVFCCRSLIPPYYMYTAHCEFVQPERSITA